MTYTAQYFRDHFPAWKHRKDFIITRIFYRPVSFYISAFCANHSISANAVSVFSSFVAVLSCVMFLFARYELNIVGAVLVSVWGLCDCTDGNLARTVGGQPFGEFVDAESSYLLVGFLGASLGISVYFTDGGGAFTEQGNPWIIFIGALASSSDTLVRLIYQKYQNVARELSDKNIIPPHRETRTENEESGSLRVRLEQWPGLGGVLPPMLVVCAVLNALDFVVYYMALYYCVGAAVFITWYTFKAMSFRKIRMKV